jgi:hypothetical protein
MNQWLRYVPAAIYMAISIVTFVAATTSYRRQEILFKKGLIGTPLLKSKTVLYMQIVLLYVCSLTSAFFAATYFFSVGK